MSIQELVVYFKIIRKRLWIIIILPVVTILTILAVLIVSDPLYQASIKFQVTAPPPVDVSIYKSFGSGSTRQEIAYTRGNFVNLLTSSSVAWESVRELGIQNQLSGSAFQENITVEDVESSDLTKITVVAKDPQLTADLINKLFEIGLRRYGQILSHSATNARGFISGQLEITRLELEQAKEILTLFRIENKIGSLSGATSTQESLLRSLQLQRDMAWAEGNTTVAAQYDELITTREVELQNVIYLSTEYETLWTDVKQTQDTYDLLLAKETEAKLKENEILNVNVIQSLGQAELPENAIPAIRPAILALGGVVSLTIGIMLAFAIEYVTTYKAFVASTIEEEKIND